jgi:hypothetical protein
MVRTLGSVAVVSAITLGVAQNSASQSLSDQSVAPAPSTFLEAPDPVDVFLGWDFSGMSDEECQAALGILYPVSQAEIEKALTPEQREERERVSLSIMNPEQYAKTYPVNLTPEQAAERDFQKWAGLHPDAYAAWLAQQTTQPVGQVITPTQPDPQNGSEAGATNVVFKPKPIIQTVPFQDARALMDKVQAQTNQTSFLP